MDFMGGFNLLGFNKMPSPVNIDMPSMKKKLAVVGTTLDHKKGPLLACHVAMRGWRRTMEDSYVMEANVRGRYFIDVEEADR